MNKVMFLGGDMRMRTACKALEERGFEVSSSGLFDLDSGQIDKSEVLVLPVPATLDNEFINCPLTNKKIPLSTIEEDAGNRLILSGGYTFKDKNCINYLQCDDYCLLNAVPTAEGAIAKAIEITNFTLWHSRVLVIGYGRISKVLCERLCGMKCSVTVSARKSSDFALADALGIAHIHTKYINRHLDSFDLIFNTIDIPVFKEIPYALKGKTLIDLSSKGCIDFKSARENSVNAVWYRGIPGKVAPLTAGKIIAQCIISLINSAS